MFAGKMLAVPACQATCHHEGSAGRTSVARRNGTWTNYGDDDGDDDDSAEEKDDHDGICDEDKAGREEHRSPAVTVSGQTITGCLSLPLS